MAMCRISLPADRLYVIVYLLAPSSTSQVTHPHGCRASASSDRGSPAPFGGAHVPLGEETLHARDGEEFVCITTREIVASQCRAQDELVIERAEADMRFRVHGHSPGESPLT